MNRRALWILPALLSALVLGCGDSKPIDPKPAGPPDTRLQPAENGRSTPAPAPAVRGD